MNIRKFGALVALLIVTIVAGFLGWFAQSRFCTGLAWLAVFGIAVMLFWRMIRRYWKLAVPVLLLLYLVAVVVSTHGMGKTTPEKETTKLVVEGESTSEMRDTTEPETTEQETTQPATRPSETTESAGSVEEETTSPQEPAGKGTAGNGSSSKGGAGTVSSTPVTPGVEETQGDADDRQRESAGLPKGGNSPLGTVETRVPEGRKDETFAPQPTTSSKEEERKVTAPPKREEDRDTIVPTDPFKEEPTTQPATQPATQAPTQPATRPTEPVTEQPTTKKADFVITDPVVKPLDPTAEILFSYTSGAGVANVLVTLQEIAPEDVSVDVSWYNTPADYRKVVNADGSLSIKVSVPENYKGTLNVTIFDSEGIEFGFKSKVVNNLDY